AREVGGEMGAAGLRPELRRRRETRPGRTAPGETVGVVDPEPAVAAVVAAIDNDAAARAVVGRGVFAAPTRERGVGECPLAAVPLPGVEVRHRVANCQVEARAAEEHAALANLVVFHARVVDASGGGRARAQSPRAIPLPGLRPALRDE